MFLAGAERWAGAGSWGAKVRVLPAHPTVHRPFPKCIWLQDHNLVCSQAVEWKKEGISEKMCSVIWKNHNDGMGWGGGDGEERLHECV